jgi:alkyl sulfatase BDS1-like metallo-beta-lactamase superfamily hydrolase
MGDSGAILAKAQADFDNGEYRWVAEVTNILVFAEPENTEARYLCADALEQLGYQAESGVWRAAYLTGAMELRSGVPEIPPGGGASGDMLRAMSPEMIFDYLGINVDTRAVSDLNAKINVNVLGRDEAPYLLTVKSGIVLYQANASAPDADLTITLPAAAVPLLLSPDIYTNENVQLEGNEAILQSLQAAIAQHDNRFNIIEP